MDKVSEDRLAKVCPALADKVRQLSDALSKEGIEIRVTQGLRSWTEQDALYAQGRTAAGKIVTNCPGGHSYHNFGLAVDVVPDDPTLAGFQSDWNKNHPAWGRIIAVAKSVGLTPGALWRTFPDFPHLQLTGRFPEGSPTSEVRQLFKDGGMETVWREAGF